MEKIVKSGLRDCTVILDGTECAVKFDTCFRAFAVRNDGAADVYISKSSGIVPDADGVMCVKSGASAVFAHMDIYADTVYLIGSSKVQVHGQQDSNNPFNFAPTFDGGVTAEGNPVTLDGLQGGVPFSEITVSGKNLLKYPYYSGENLTVNNVEFTANADGTIHIKSDGAVTARSVFWLENAASAFSPPKNTPIYISASDNQISNIDIGFGLLNGTSWINSGSIPVTGNEKIFDYDGYDRLVFNITVNAGESVDVTLHPQLELGSTSTEYEPPITGRELQVNVSGRNLLKNKLSTITWMGVTATVNDDGSVTISRTASSDSDAYIVLWNNIPARDVANQKIAINAINGQSLETCYMGVDRLENGTYMNRIAVGLINNGVGIVTQEDVDNERMFRSWVFIHKDYAPNNLIIYPQLEIGSTATPYEPYHGSVTTITPDSNPYTIPNDIRQQDGLNVVTASAGTLNVVGVRKNAAIKKIWGNMGMDLLFDGLALESSPATGLDLGDYDKYLINCYNAVSAGRDYSCSIIVERDRLECIISNGQLFVHSLAATYTLEMHFSGTIDNATYYAKQNNDAEAPYSTRIYGIK